MFFFFFISYDLSLYLLWTSQHLSHSIRFIPSIVHEDLKTFRVLFPLLLEDFIFLMNVIKWWSSPLRLKSWTLLEIAELRRSFVDFKKVLKESFKPEPSFLVDCIANHFATPHPMKCQIYAKLK